MFPFLEDFFDWLNDNMMTVILWFAVISIAAFILGILIRFTKSKIRQPKKQSQNKQKKQKLKNSFVDIKKGSPLSPVHNYTFMVEGIRCRSIESFVKSLAYQDAKKQQEVCKMAGKEAARIHPTDWQSNQQLYWKGKPFNRDSFHYQRLLSKAYDGLIKHKGFRKALMDTNNARLMYDHLGSFKEHELMTEMEMLNELYRLRQEL